MPKLGAVKDKDKNKWISNCISVRQDEHPNEDNKQSVAICHSMWRDVHGGKKPEKKK